MKKFKKLIAGLSAAAMAMTVGVSAFAAQTGKATASYENGYVRLSNTSDINATNQWTVVIIPKAKQLSTLSDSDLLYINQGTDAEPFWTGTITTNADSTTTVSGGMGVKGGTLPDGDYIVRIGGETITDASKVIEIALTVGGGEVTYYYGDVNFTGGYPDLDDAIEIINYTLWEASVFDDENPQRFVLGNITADRETNDAVDLDDAIEIINYVLWEPSTLDELIPIE
ncbi:MAG: hypothetical protein SOZ34_07205 [Clostridia bacterium]|nr:hypothetical protein [Clostridia bacterium]